MAESLTKKKKILVAAHLQITCASIRARIVDFLGEYADVITWSVGDSNEAPARADEADLFVVFTRQAYELCRMHCPPDKPLLVAERVISVQHLDELLGLDDSTTTYVVGSNYETTFNTIAILRGLGFSRLRFKPCYSGMPEPVSADITVAITPGLPDLVPPHITTVIDVGPKEIAMSSLAEIMLYLGIPLTALDNITNFYIKTLLANTRERSLMGFQNKLLNNRLEAILNTLQEAIVALDDKKKIVVYNQASEKIFTIPIAKAIGSDWQDVLPDSVLADCLASGESANRSIKFINGQHYMINAAVIPGHDRTLRGLVATFHPVQEIMELETQVRSELKTKANLAKYSFKDIKGSSGALRYAVFLADKFAATDLTILLEGESGTGKELFAQAIHNRSSRRRSPFVAINFAAIPDNLVESELFGYEEGAFTGARKGGKPGVFEEAHTGTIFLDEIGSATQDVQKRLLRVLEEQEIRRLGGSRNTPVDVRVIAASNVDLEELVKRKIFRDDLYYRLCALPVRIPSLKDRKADIVPLAVYFAKKYTEKMTFSPEITDIFRHYAWPGNIRELQNVVKYLCTVVEPGQTASSDSLPPYLLRKLGIPYEKEKAGSRPGAGHFQKELAFLAGEFQSPDPQKIILPLLSEIRAATSVCRGIGSSTLCKRINGCLPGVSEYYIKKWMKILKSIGYVETGRTKRGTSLTDKGNEFLQAFREADP